MGGICTAHVYAVTASLSIGRATNSCDLSTLQALGVGGAGDQIAAGRQSAHFVKPV